MSEITPDTITFSGSVEYDDAEDVLDALSELKEIESLDHFNNQVIDLDADEPAIAFTNRVDENNINSVYLQSAPSPDQLPEEPPLPGEEWDEDDVELNTLAISINFVHDDRDMLESALVEILEVVESISLQGLFFSLTLEESFEDLATISRLDANTDFDLQAVVLGEEDYQYSLQEMGDETEVYAVYEGNGKVDRDSIESFIQDQIQAITPSIEQICYEG